MAAKRLLLCAVLFMIILSTVVNSSDYFPLGANKKWVYNQYGYNGRFVGVDSMIIFSDTIIDDTHYYKERYVAKWAPSYATNDFLYNHGDTVFMTDSSRALKAIAGYHVYHDGGIINLKLGGVDTIKYVGTITVAAGTFDSCYFVPSTRTEGLYIAPNVGLIKIIQKISSNIKLSHELISRE
jgi:hypothetical protein